MAEQHSTAASFAVVDEQTPRTWRHVHEHFQQYAYKVTEMGTTIENMKGSESREEKEESLRSRRREQPPEITQNLQDQQPFTSITCHVFYFNLKERKRETKCASTTVQSTLATTAT